MPRADDAKKLVKSIKNGYALDSPNVVVGYGIAGTATQGTGYTVGGGATGTLTFAAGAATAAVTVDPTADTSVESDETVAR